MKMKRKDFEMDYAGNDVVDFTLFSPACKIRRLDADLPLGMPDMDLRFEQRPFSEFCAADGGESRSRGLVTEELPPVDENQERAIVLFKPINTPVLHSPSHFVVDTDLISSIKDQAAWGVNSNSSRYLEDKESETNERLAVIPWVPPEQFHQAPPPEVFEPMDAEDMGTTMESEDDIVGSGAQTTNECTHTQGSSEAALQQWQQQHCMIPQLPQNTTTPIVWYR